MNRRSTSVFAVVAAVAATLVTAMPAQAAEEFNPFATREAAPVATDRVIVRLRAGGPANAATKPELAAAAQAERMAAVGERAGVRTRNLRQLGTDMQVVQVDLAASGGSLDAALLRLRADPAVEFAEPDARMRPHRVPNDPGFVEQWSLQAPVATANGRTASAVDVVAAWDTTLGSPGVVVAVLDTGVRFDHPDLRRVAEGGKLLPGYDFVGTDSNGTARTANDGDGWDADPSDPGDWISSEDRLLAQFANCSLDHSSWHGTRVAGMLAGLTDNQAGIAGLGWGNLILPVRVLGKCGGYVSDIIAGMRWAAGLAQPGAPSNPTPARILNLSLGGEGACSSAYQAALDEVTGSGVLVVVSAGNDGSLTDQPANCRGVASVTGIRHAGTKVGFANLGSDVTIAAPGGNCVNVGAGEPCLFSLDTTTNLGVTIPGANGYTDRVVNINVGTSFAAPIVSGIAGLMASVNGNLAPAELIERLQATATLFPVSSSATVPTCRVPLSDADTQLSECNCTTATCGAGMVNAPGAVAAALQPIAILAGPSSAEAGSTVSLSGAGSLGADGRAVTSYAWTLVSGSTSLSALAGPTTSFVAPAFSGEVVVRLTVTDDAGRTDATTAKVSVSGPPAPPPIVVPPIGGGGGGGGGGSADFLLLALAVFAGARGVSSGRRHPTRSCGRWCSAPAPGRP
jgi:serine protease